MMQHLNQSFLLLCLLGLLALVAEAHEEVGIAAGFVFATGMLHRSGIAIGSLFCWPAGALVVPTAGVVVAAVGVYFLPPHLKAVI